MCLRRLGPQVVSELLQTNDFQRANQTPLDKGNVSLMAELVTNCPRCKAKNITFHVLADFSFDTLYGWMRRYEAFARCSHCHRGSVFITVRAPHLACSRDS
jgi:hypothetical protein